ncbi:uncharacterized protein LOC129587874 [Paramacrobiotus metropolitanus]|uniref:uncharacterized protein LOC129587874 n=1 Tax=Paramacrobiotus metropolitanus TaxID=2943436 RepID=UPI0024459B88|nr:uncharacterized protein LOC129587874 [Paramacrobiotus metropolitanus]
MTRHEEFIIDDSFQIFVQHTEIPVGRCLKDVPALLMRRLKKMKSVVVVDGNDDLCMARALMIGKALADNDQKLFRSLRRVLIVLYAFVLIAREMQLIRLFVGTCRCIYSNARRKPDNPHRCGETKCKTCGVFDLPADHRCYMRPKPFTLDRKTKCSASKFLYFDFETYVSSSGDLVPNLAVVQNDEGVEWIFPDSVSDIGQDVTDDLCAFLFQENHHGYYVIAHNFKGFDGYFILNWLLRNGIVPKVIMNGGKILMLDVPAPYNIHFRDSYNYNPQSLSKWPATFGLQNASKGTFPHRFNRPENWNRVVPFPSKDEYGYGSMKMKDRMDFDRWYDAEFAAKGGVFDFRKEFVQYCQNDVTVLRQCCQQFAQLFTDISDGLNPFVSAATIAGVCSVYWRTFLLKPEQIGLIPNQGFGRNRPQSAKALRWLQWMEAEGQCEIQSKVTGSEHKIGSYFVDGFCVQTNTVYEFHGCWFHGCPQCFAGNTVHPYRGLKMSDVYRETMDRDQYFKDMGYKVIVVWEHEYDRMRVTDPEFNDYVRTVNIQVGINPRDAFYGGRTNAVKLHHKVVEDERICYYDVCSEYPFVNKTKRYPTGHPIIITKDFADPRSYFGLMSCKVLPPDDLYLPILPYRSKDKLTFPLCRTCADQRINAPCEHEPHERALTGTWCTPEIAAALDRGYVIAEIYEVWHFDQHEDRLFEGYINKFLKIKTEASGWPTDVTTEDQKTQYIQEYQAKEAIQLDSEKVQENPGLRSLAKLMLNSFWGRLGMQNNKLTTEYVSDPARFYELLLSGQYHVHSWDLFGEEVLQVMYTKEEGFIEDNPSTNVVLAAFTTCWARLHLLQFMEQVQDRLLYFDTDSIIFVDRPDQPKPETGKFLGDLTDELKPGQYITEFVSLGPKTYAYRTNDDVSIVKLKGFTLNGATSELINFERMLSMLDTSEEVNVNYPDSIQRHKPSLTLRQRDMSKKFRMTYDKRRIVENWNTLPFGYVPK